MIDEEFYSQILMSEFANKNFVKHRFPMSGGIELMSECNLRCLHCYEASCRNKENVSTKQLKKIIDELTRLGTLSVFLTGGEAMLREDFDDIYKYIRQKGILVTILSNGTTITDSKIELFKEYPPVELSISIYGASEETYVKTCRVAGAFSKLISGLDKLRDNQINFNLKTVLMDTNVDDLDEMRKIANYYGVGFKFFTNIRPMNDGNKEPMNHMLDLNQIIDLETKDPIICDFYNNIEKFANKKWETRKDKDYKYLCRIAANGFFITNDGMLFGCVRERLHGIDLKKCNVEEAWTNHFVSTYVNSVLNEKSICRNCEYMKYCDYCPAQFELETGSTNKPPQDICKLAKMRKMVFEGGTTNDRI